MKRWIWEWGWKALAIYLTVWFVLGFVIAMTYWGSSDGAAIGPVIHEHRALPMFNH